MFFITLPIVGYKIMRHLNDVRFIHITPFMDMHEEEHQVGWSRTKSYSALVTIDFYSST